MELDGRHIQEATLEITVIRADGTVEHLGVVDSYKTPGWRRLTNRMFKWLRL